MSMEVCLQCVVNMIRSCGMIRSLNIIDGFVHELDLRDRLLLRRLALLFLHLISCYLGCCRSSGFAPFPA